MAAQDDSTPWVLPPSLESTTDQPLPSHAATAIDVSVPNVSTEISASQVLHGRGFFSELGTVRRKPSRPDAPPTLSKSCSDKLALKQCTSLLTSITSMLISPSNLYISSLTLPESQYSETACTRAFSSTGRMKEMKNQLRDGGYRFKAFDIKTTSKEFKFSRRQALVAGDKLVPSNISASWIPDRGVGVGSLETLIGGVLQGRKQFDVRGASRVCKRRMWRLAIEIAGLAAMPAVERCLRMATYNGVKRSRLLEDRRNLKDDVRINALKGWIRNVGGEEFGLEGIDA